MNYPNKEEEEN